MLVRMPRYTWEGIDEGDWAEKMEKSEVGNFPQGGDEYTLVAVLLGEVTVWLVSTPGEGPRPTIPSGINGLGGLG